jgi:hypothetical protein
VDHFEKNHGGNVDDKILVFGTKDGGFGELKKENGIVHPTGPLDKSFQGGLPPTKLFTSLGDLVKFVKSKGRINFLKATEPTAQEEKEQEVPVMVEIEEPFSAPANYVLDAEPGRFGVNEAVISVPSAGGRVIDIVVRDHVGASDSLSVTQSSTTQQRLRTQTSQTSAGAGSVMDQVRVSVGPKSWIAFDGTKSADVETLKSTCCPRRSSHPRPKRRRLELD